MKVGAQLLKENQKYLKFLETLLILLPCSLETPSLSHSISINQNTLVMYNCTYIGDLGIMTIVLDKKDPLVKIMAIKSPI